MSVNTEDKACPVCGRVFGILRRGLLPVHGLNANRCEGSGELPVTVRAKTTHEGAPRGSEESSIARGVIMARARQVMATALARIGAPVAAILAATEETINDAADAALDAALGKDRPNNAGMPSDLAWGLFAFWHAHDRDPDHAAWCLARAERISAHEGFEYAVALVAKAADPWGWLSAFLPAQEPQS